MGESAQQGSSAKVWELARRQHGVVTRSQLIELGLSRRAIEHRLVRGRLHPLRRGVYAVGRPEVGRKGQWLAAALSCGPRALLSHRTAAALWGIWPTADTGIDVVVPVGTYSRQPGIRVHRRLGLAAEHRREVSGIPVTDPVSTLVDLAGCVPEWRVERAVNEADRLDLIDPPTLRAEIRDLQSRPGMACLRRLLGCDALTDTGLERKFMAIVRSAGLSRPQTQQRVSGYRVDFYWPELGLVVETDGWRYHRTAGEQATDHRRDQAHTAAGLTTLRFAESQVRYRPGEVRARLGAVASRLRKSAA